MFNFYHSTHWRKYFNGENFPVYSIWITNFLLFWTQERRPWTLSTHALILAYCSLYNCSFVRTTALGKGSEEILNSLPGKYCTSRPALCLRIWGLFGLLSLQKEVRSTPLALGRREVRTVSPHFNNVWYAVIATCMHVSKAGRGEKGRGVKAGDTIRTVGRSSRVKD